MREGGGIAFLSSGRVIACLHGPEALHVDCVDSFVDGFTSLVTVVSTVHDGGRNVVVERRFEDFTSQNTGRGIAGLRLKKLRSRARILFLGFIACPSWIMSFSVSRAVVAAVAFARQGDCVGRLQESILHGFCK